MRTAELISLHCERFKGMVEKDFDFGGKNASFWGANATGKSTVADAFSWLLFGKNAFGESDFEIKPRSIDGSLLFPGAETVVSARLRMDGEEFELKRVFKENWTARRGSVDKVFSGNTTDYYVDGFPVKKSEYEEKVSMFSSEKVFRLISSVGSFFKLHHKEQRELLFEISGVATDFEIASKSDEFALIAPDLARHTVEEVRKKLMSDRKKLSEARNNIPPRLDELNQTKRRLSAVNFEEVKKECADLAGQKQLLLEEKAAANTDNISAQYDLKRRKIYQDLELLEQANKVHRASQENAIGKSHEKLMLQDRMTYLDQSIKRIASAVARKEEDVKFNENVIQKLRDDYASEDKKKPVFGKECPTCKRPYEETAIRAAETKFLEEKKERLGSICQKASDLAAQNDKIKEELSALSRELSEMRSQYSAAEAALGDLIKAESLQNIVSDLPDYEEKKADCKAFLKVLDKEEAAENAQIFEKVVEIEAKIAVIDAAIMDRQAKVAGERVLEETNRRIADLESEARALSAEIETADHKIFLLEEFTRFKVSSIEESINNKFSITKFKLFHEQVNGGIADTCEAMRDGVPYSDLNTGSRVNVGIDVVNALCEFYGVCAPIFIDNAEGVTEWMEPIGQTIKLYVSENDKEMRFEVE